MIEALTLDHLLEKIGEVFDNQKDSRKQDRCKYKLRDAGLGAFSVFLTQSPSFLSHQRTMAKRKGKSNAEQVFALKRIPTDTHMRTLLDGISSDVLKDVYRYMMTSLVDTKKLDEFTVPYKETDYVLLAMDGTEYHRSSKIHCQQCCQRVSKTGKVSYHHSMIPPVMVHPARSEVLSLEPEMIRPQDGDAKQDCESKAMKRWLKESAPHYPLEKVMVLCDDLLCHQPQCEAVLERGWDFIFVCKPESHKTLYRHLQKADVHTFRRTRWNGRFREIHTYSFASDLPLKDADDALRVQWCELHITHENTGETLYRNRFVTSLPITNDSVIDVVRYGRARWKTENENNNTLKRQGHHLEHNYGHGSNGLSALLVSLIILAFLCHTLFRIWDDRYQAIRDDFGSRKAFFDSLRSQLIFQLFASWSQLLDSFLQDLDIALPHSTPSLDSS